MRWDSLELGKANLNVFADTLMKLAESDPDLLVATSDSRGSGKLAPFGTRFPEHMVEIGIAEQNLVGVSAGLASMGKKVFAVSPACFMTARSLEQIKNDVAYSDHPVKLIGISAGVSYGSLGSTHHSLHDLATLQTIHNIDIVVPADNFEAEQAILAAINHPKPLFIRFGKKAMPNLHAPDAKFEIGKALYVTPIQDSYDVAFIATGEVVCLAVEAAAALNAQGIQAAVLSAHTIKPFDAETVRDLAARAGAVITVEEHSEHGGLGSLVAAMLLQDGYHKPFKICAIPDEHTVTGSQMEILSHYGISADGLVATAKKLVAEK